MKRIIDISEDDLDAIKFLKVKGWASRHELLILDGIPIPDNATNGEVFGKIMDYMFMDDAYITTDKHGYLHLRGVKDDWWNAPYQKGGKE